MLDETRHAIEDRLALVDLHAPEGVDAMADEYVRPIVNRLMTQFDQELRRAVVVAVRLVAEGILVSMDRHDHEVRILLANTDAPHDPVQIPLVDRVVEASDLFAHLVPGAEQDEFVRLFVGGHGGNWNSDFGTMSVRPVADLAQ